MHDGICNSKIIDKCWQQPLRRCRQQRQHFFIQFHTVLSSNKKKEQFQLILSFTYSSLQSSSFYTLEKKITRNETEQNKVQQDNGEIVVDRNTNRICPYSFSLILLNNNNSILQLGNGERKRERKQEKKNFIVKILKIHRSRKKESENFEIVSMYSCFTQ